MIKTLTRDGRDVHFIAKEDTSTAVAAPGSVTTTLSERYAYPGLKNQRHTWQPGVAKLVVKGRCLYTTVSVSANTVGRSRAHLPMLSLDFVDCLHRKTDKQQPARSNVRRSRSIQCHLTMCHLNMYHLNMFGMRPRLSWNRFRPLV